MTLCGIFHVVSCFPLHFMLYCGNLDFFLDSELGTVKTELSTMAEILWSLTLPSFYGGNLTCKTMKFLQLLGPYLRNRLQNSNTIHCPNSYQNFRDITWNIEENEILHEIFHVVSRFPRYILCYISENGLPLGQCRRIGWIQFYLQIILVQFILLFKSS